MALRSRFALYRITDVAVERNWMVSRIIRFWQKPADVSLFSKTLTPVCQEDRMLSRWPSPAFGIRHCATVYIQLPIGIHFLGQYSILPVTFQNFWYVFQLLCGLRHTCWLWLNTKVELEVPVKNKTCRHEQHLFAFLRPLHRFLKSKWRITQHLCKHPFVQIPSRIASISFARQKTFLNHWRYHMKWRKIINYFPVRREYWKTHLHQSPEALWLTSRMA